jgi:hypothetical protein
MTYDEARDAEQLRILGSAINAFINRYQNAQPGNAACRRQTVFFFPGGMASRLRRATQPYQEGVGVPANTNYEDLWVAWDTLLGGWRKLKMHKDGLGCFRDEDDRVVVADDAVALEQVSPHDLFIHWCNQNNADWFVFGWDWRRRLDETVTFFVSKFLPYFQTRVMNAGCPDPLANFSLIGHSFGGMIVNLVLRGNHSNVANMTYAITVATPFYGYAGQMHRWFEGDPWILVAWGSLGTFLKQSLIEVICSMPGLYTLLFLDEATYTAPAISAGLNAPGQFQIGGYPSTDRANVALHADPYNPQTNGPLVRYPINAGFDLSELQYAKGQLEQMGSALPTLLAPKLYNIRGVCADTNGVPTASTVGKVTCDWIQPSFSALFDPSPVSDGPLVAGDDTQPAWTARLATNNQFVDVVDSNLHHALMMDHPKTVAAIESILCAPKPAANPPPSGSGSNPLPHWEIIKFLRWLFRHRRRFRRWPPIDSKRFRAVLPREFARNLRGIARTMLMDMMRGHVRPERNKKGPRSGGRKPTRGRRTRRPAKKK